jgi:hypothetical protein
VAQLITADFFTRRSFEVDGEAKIRLTRADWFRIGIHTTCCA